MHTHKISSDLSPSHYCLAADARIIKLEAEIKRLREGLKEFVSAICNDLDCGQAVSVRVGAAYDQALEALGHD